MNTQQLLAKLKAFPLAVGLIGVAVLMAGWAYWRAGALAAAQTSLDAKTEEHTIIYNNVNADTGLAAQATQLGEDLKVYEAALINPTQVIANQQYFFGYENTTGVVLVDPAQAATIRSKDAAEPSITAFTLTASGHWDNIVSFIYGLQSGPRLLRFNIFRLEKSDQQNSSGDINRLMLTLTVEILGK